MATVRKRSYPIRQEITVQSIGACEWRYNHKKDNIIEGRVIKPVTLLDCGEKGLNSELNNNQIACGTQWGVEK
ncbi:MAG: hypothetical protein ACTSR8_12255 [Promethearchaeota archaeon]